MNYENKFLNLVLNSKDYFYLFELDSIGSLSYKIYNMSFDLVDRYFIEEKSVLKYSIVLDSFNNILLAYLMKNGELHLNTYKDEKWNNSIIGYFDTKSNRYNQFEILYLKEKLHLIYTYANLINSNIYTIQHIIYDNKIEEKHNIIRYVSRKLGDPFTIDIDSLETIHLLYNTITNNDSYIFHSFYSPYTKSWSNNPKELSSPDSQNLTPYLFVDTQSNLHGVWIEKSKSNNSLKYLRMATKGKEKYIWKPINIPHISPENNRPIIYEEDSMLKILYTRNDELFYISSVDFGISWSKEVLVKTEDSISIINVTSSTKLFPSLKAKHILGKGGINPGVYLLNTISNNKSLTKDVNSEIDLIVETPIDTIVEEPDYKEIEQIKEETFKIDFLWEEIENVRESQRELKLILNRILEQEEFILDNIKKINASLENNKSSFWDRLFKS